MLPAHFGIGEALQTHRPIMRGHEEASGVKYVPPHLFEEWAKKDPVENFEKYLLDKGVLTPTLITNYRAEMI